MIKEYLEKIKDNIYGKNCADKGVDLEQIEACEKRLKIELEKILTIVNYILKQCFFIEK